MQRGQKFCCECGAPIAKYEETKESVSKVRLESSSTKPTPQKNKGGKIFAKVIVTLIILAIVAAIATSIGGVPSYIAGGICLIIIPNVWKLIDDF